MSTDTPSSGVPETAVIFINQGGHEHNGVDSTLIDFSQYSTEQLDKIQAQLGIPKSDPNSIPIFPSGAIISGNYIGDTSSLPGPGGTTAPNTPSGLRLVTGSTFVNYEQVYIDVFWGAPDSSDPSSARITSYEVELIEDGLGQVQAPARIQAPTTQYRFIPVKPSTRYGIRVRCIDNLGQSSAFLPSVGYEYITSAVDQTIPDTVTGVGIGCGLRTATIFWDESADPDVASGRGSYHVQIATDNVFITGLQDKVVSATVTSFTNLNPQTTYYARVTAIDSSGNESVSWSTIVSATTAAVTDSDIQAGTINADRLIAGSITATQIQAGTITADKLAANSIIADDIATGTLDACTITIGPTGLLRAGTVSGVRTSTEYENLILGTSSLVAYYQLSDVTTTAVDLGPHGLNGTYSGTYTQGVAGALSNDSTNKGTTFGNTSTGVGQVDIANNSVFNLNHYSIECWFKATNTSIGYQLIVGKDDPSTSNWGLWGDVGTRKVYINHSVGTTYYTVESLAPLSSSGYTHVVGTYDGVYLKLYINGALNNVIPASGTPSTNTNAVGIGYDPVGSYPVKGNDIDEVAIYNAALTDNDILQHYLSARNSYQYLIEDANGIRFYNKGSSAFTGGNLVMELNIAEGSGTFYGALSANSMYAGNIVGGVIAGAIVNGSVINGGTINGTVINGVTINGDTINGATINGGLIIGTTIETAASGQRLKLISSAMELHTASGRETAPGSLWTYYDSSPRDESVLESPDVGYGRSAIVALAANQEISGKSLVEVGTTGSLTPHFRCYGDIEAWGDYIGPSPDGVRLQVPCSAGGTVPLKFAVVYNSGTGQYDVQLIWTVSGTTYFTEIAPL